MTSDRVACNDRRQPIPCRGACHCRCDAGPRSYTIHIGHCLPGVGRRHHAASAEAPPLRHRHRPPRGGAPSAIARGSFRGSGITTAVVVVPPGEASKSYDGLSNLCDRLLAAGVERSDLVIAFGGGVIGDLAGFASAILRRGSPMFRCRPPFSRKSIPRSAARPGSIRQWART